jgi:HSP20 family molecular chaperone IbpA
MANLEKTQANGGSGTYFEQFAGMENWRRFMDSFFEPLTPPTFFRAFDVELRANVYEKDGKYTIEFAVPGCKRDDINVEVKAHEVTVSGKY